MKELVVPTLNSQLKVFNTNCCAVCLCVFQKRGSLQLHYTFLSAGEDGALKLKNVTVYVNQCYAITSQTTQVIDPLNQVHFAPQVCAKHYSNGWEGTNQQKILVPTSLHFSEIGNK